MAKKPPTGSLVKQAIQFRENLNARCTRMDKRVADLERTLADVTAAQIDADVEDARRHIGIDERLAAIEANNQIKAGILADFLKRLTALENPSKPAPCCCDEPITLNYNISCACPSPFDPDQTTRTQKLYLYGDADGPPASKPWYRRAFRAVRNWFAAFTPPADPPFKIPGYCLADGCNNAAYENSAYCFNHRQNDPDTPQVTRYCPACEARAKDEAKRTPTAAGPSKSATESGIPLRCLPDAPLVCGLAPPNLGYAPCTRRLGHDGPCAHAFKGGT